MKGFCVADDVKRLGDVVSFGEFSSGSFGKGVAPEPGEFARRLARDLVVDVSSVEAGVERVGRGGERLESEGVTRRSFGDLFGGAGLVAAGVLGSLPGVPGGLGRLDEAADVLRLSEGVDDVAGGPVKGFLSLESENSLKPFYVGASEDGVPLPPIATYFFDSAQKNDFHDNNLLISKFDYEEMSGLKDVVARDVLDTNFRMSARNMPMSNYSGEDSFASAVSDAIVEPSNSPLGVNNLYESVIYWNHVGNKNIQSVLRTGDLSSEESFLRSLEYDWDSEFVSMSRAEVIQYFEDITEKSIKFIDDAMKNSRHPDFVAYRGVNGIPMRQFLGEDFVRALESDKSSVVGAEITDPGFLAVSLSASEASGFAREGGNYGYVWQFRVPENFDALPISGNWERPGVGLPQPGEREVLLPKGLTLEVVDVQTPADVFAAFNPGGVRVDKLGNGFEIRYDPSMGYFNPWQEDYGFSSDIRLWQPGTWTSVPNGLITFKIKGT